MTNNNNPPSERTSEGAEGISDAEKRMTIRAIWSKDILQTNKTLEGYCGAVAARFKAMFGETIGASPEEIYDALNRKDLL